MPQPPITFNLNRKPVTVTENRLTGLQVKQAAIDAGIEIALDFQLKIRHGNSPWEVVGDDDMVTVNKSTEFRAVTPDDNS